MTPQQRRTALVTGAGRGIGRAIALALADAGFDVAVNDLPGSDDLAETTATIEQRGRKAVALAADISDVAAHPHSANTNSTAIMVGERAADFIRGNR